ncbi:MAG: cytochrome c [Actinomycetota bacterium]|nr:cytochrome c [Actinomycetota bacterium]
MGRRRGRRARILLGALAVVVVLAAIVGYGAWYKLFREVPQRFDSAAERFKYGSIGNETAEGIPYWVWRVLPEMFPEHLPGPGGYRSLGFNQEQGRDLPIGFSRKTIGFPRVGFNCAACHSGSYRTRADEASRPVLTAPGTRVDFQGYARFLVAAGTDPRFTPDNVLDAIERHTDLSWVDRQLYKRVIIPRTRDGLVDYSKRFTWMNSRPPWGRGRIDPFNPVKFHQLGLDPAKDRTIGNSDMEPLWNMARKDGYSLHWDGLNDSLTEVVLTGAIGDGATSVGGKAPSKSLPVDDLKRIEDFIKETQPPRYPFPIDRGLAARGQRVFRESCAACHEFGAPRTGTVVPQAEVGTDRHRLDMWTREATDRYNDYARDYPFRFKRFVKTNGYVAVPLDGVWLRAPYLHNGSVPTLEDLLEPVADRPKLFYRGYDVYDRERTGWIHQGAAARRAGFRYDIRVPGNSNAGHEYGTELSPSAKRALVEYLKTR